MAMNITLDALSITIYLVEIIVALAVSIMVCAKAQAYIRKWKADRAEKLYKKIRAEQLAYRTRKEKAANEGFFEESYVPGVDHEGREVYYVAVAPTDKARQFYRDMDRLHDHEIFKNTEEL